MRVKEQQQKQHEQEFEDELSFEQWLDCFNQEPTSQELDGMEKECNAHNIPYALRPLNNLFYINPLQGA